jgi:hypothetical protein
LALDADAAAVQAFRDAAIALKVPLTVVEDVAAGEAARYEAALVLVRPDQFVAWSAGEARITADEARQIIGLARGGVATG